MRKIPVLRIFLLAGVACLVSCVPPHPVDPEPAAAPESEERAPAETEGQESEASEPDSAEPE